MTRIAENGGQQASVDPVHAQHRHIVVDRALELEALA